MATDVRRRSCCGREERMAALTDSSYSATPVLKVVKEGWLLKRSKRVKVYRKRWMRLTTYPLDDFSLLNSFKNERGAQRGDAATETCTIDSMSFFEVSVNADGSRSVKGEIVLHSSGDHSFHFRCEDDRERHQWLLALSKVIDSHYSHPIPSRDTLVTTMEDDSLRVMDGLQEFKDRSFDKLFESNIRGGSFELAFITVGKVQRHVGAAKDMRKRHLTLKRAEVTWMDLVSYFREELLFYLSFQRMLTSEDAINSLTDARRHSVTKKPPLPHSRSTAPPMKLKLSISMPVSGMELSRKRSLSLTGAPVFPKMGDTPIILEEDEKKEDDSGGLSHRRAKTWKATRSIVVADVVSAVVSGSGSVESVELEDEELEDLEWRALSGRPKPRGRSAAFSEAKRFVRAPRRQTERIVRQPPKRKVPTLKRYSESAIGKATSAPSTKRRGVKKKKKKVSLCISKSKKEPSKPLPKLPSATKRTAAALAFSVPLDLHRSALRNVERLVLSDLRALGAASARDSGRLSSVVPTHSVLKPKDMEMIAGMCLSAHSLLKSLSISNCQLNNSHMAVFCKEGIRQLVSKIGIASGSCRLQKIILTDNIDLTEYSMQCLCDLMSVGFMTGIAAANYPMDLPHARYVCFDGDRMLPHTIADSVTEDPFAEECSGLKTSSGALVRRSPSIAARNGRRTRPLKMEGSKTPTPVSSTTVSSRKKRLSSLSPRKFSRRRGSESGVGTGVAEIRAFPIIADKPALAIKHVAVDGTQMGDVACAIVEKFCRKYLNYHSLQSVDFSDCANVTAVGMAKLSALAPGRAPEGAPAFAPTVSASLKGKSVVLVTSTLADFYPTPRCIHVKVDEHLIRAAHRKK